MFRGVVEKGRCGFHGHGGGEGESVRGRNGDAAYE